MRSFRKNYRQRHDFISLTNPDNTITLLGVEKVISILLNAIPDNWLNEIYSSDRVVTTQADFDYPTQFFCGGETIDGGGLTCKKACELFRTLTNNLPKGEIHWRNIYRDLTFDTRWGNVFRSPKVNTDAEIDFKILHNILYTNEKLYKYNLIDSPLCTLCKGEVETIHHLFICCTKVSKLWKSLINNLNTVYALDSQEQWIVGTLFGLGLNRRNQSGVLIDYILNVYKCVVWKSRNSINRNGGTINVDLFFHNSIKKRIGLIYAVYKSNDILNNFFKLFGIANVLLSAAEDNTYRYNLDTG